MLSVHGVRRRAVDDSGAAAVEFALVMPLLVILVFGIFEFGISFAQQLSLSNAARQGARFAAVQNPDGSGNPTTTCATIFNQVRSAAGTIGMSSANVKVTITAPTGGQTCTTAGGLPATAVTDFITSTNAPCVGSTSGDSVQVQATYVGHLTIPLVFANPSFTYSSKGVYQCEYQH